MEDIANGVSSNVFTAGSNDALAALKTGTYTLNHLKYTLSCLFSDIFNAICSQARRSFNPSPQRLKVSNHIFCLLDQRSSTINFQTIVNRFIYEAASKYKNKFTDVPNWLPDYQKWKAGQIQFFRYQKK